MNEDVTRWVAAQGERDKLVLSLLLVDGLTPAEVAAVLDIDPQQVEDVARHAVVAVRALTEGT